MWPIQFAFHLCISYRIFLCSLTLSNTFSFLTWLLSVLYYIYKCVKWQCFLSFSLALRLQILGFPICIMLLQVNCIWFKSLDCVAHGKLLVISERLLGGVKTAQNENRVFYGMWDRRIWVPNTHEWICPRPRQTANVISRVTPMGTNLKLILSIDYRGKSNVELILTNENYIAKIKSTKNKLIPLMTSTVRKNKISSAVFLLLLHEI
jgi:hypothetical protein